MSFGVLAGEISPGASLNGLLDLQFNLRGVTSRSLSFPLIGDTFELCLEGPLTYYKYGERNENGMAQDKQGEQNCLLEGVQS